MSEDENYRYLFVVTYGRSGSTLLNGVLNSIDGYKILGENFNSFIDLYEFHNKMIRARGSNDACERNHGIFKDRNPWWNDYSNYNLKDGMCSCIEYIYDPVGEYRVIGFKEIRWGSMADRLDDYLRFLTRIFNPRFIFLTRNLDETCKSGWHKDNPDCKKKLQLFENRINKYIRIYDDGRWFHLHFKELYKVEPNDFKPLFRFLDETYHYDTVKEVLDKVHGYNAGVKK